MQPLATVGELEAHLQRDVQTPSAELALALASGAVRAYCGWDLAYETATFEVDGIGNNVVSLPTLRLIDLAELRVDDVVVDLVADGVQWSKKGQLYRPCGFTRHAVIQADVIHGYDPVPDLIKLCTLDLAACQQSNPESLVSATTGQVSRTWQVGGSGYALSALHERLLDRFRL